jgi:MFS family permease
MTGKHQYWAYFMSRYFAGFFGMVVSILGPRYLVDLFFLHQRGRAFTVLHVALNFGASAGPTFSGYVAAKRNWPIEYWWSVALLGVSAILVFCFLEETGYDRVNPETNVEIPEAFVANRVRTFLPGHRVVKPATLTEVVSCLESSLQFDRLISYVGQSWNPAIQNRLFACGPSRRRL